MASDMKIEIFASKKGIPTLRMNDYFIHSKYDPVKEAQQFAQRHYEKDCYHIVFGNGLGYYTDAIQKLSTSQNDFIVFDPVTHISTNSEVYHDFQYTSLKHLLEEKLIKWRQLKVICIPNYDKLFPEEYKILLNFTRDQLAVAKIFENTIQHFSNVWQDNYLENLINIPQDLTINTLSKKYHNPVVVASAGPSLAKHISLLKQYEGNYILVAAGSAITALMKYNLEPAYVVTMDGGKANLMHFESVTLNKARLVYSLVTQSQIRKRVQQPSYHFLSTDCYELEGHYEYVTNRKPLKLIGGGSVATYALAFARYISTGPITLVGQDLAYTENYTHDKNNRQAKIITEAYIKKRGIFQTNGYGNKKVLTDHAFFAMKEVFEKMYSELELNEQIFNSTASGLILEGYPTITLEEFLKENALTPVHISLSHQEGSKEWLNDFSEKLRRELSVYDEIEQLLLENKKLLKAALQIHQFKKKSLEILEKNEKSINKRIPELAIGIAIKKITLRVLTEFQAPPSNETEYMKFSRIYKQSESLYNQLLELVQRAKCKVQGIIEEMQQMEEQNG